uniref:AcidPPc domain-containing protein n=1 Tax=Meloidogyne hapla TaxID=6305 RepID=A0A1I8BUC7_MELHA
MNLIIQKHLENDKYLSENIAKIGSNGISKKLKIEKICLVLEWIMHGIPWIFGVFILIFLAHTDSEIHFLNLLAIALFLDLALVGLLKISFRRDRPKYNKGKLILGAPIIDDFSFPSGHTSRTTMLFIIFVYIKPDEVFEYNKYLNYLFILFPSILLFSRILSGRHFFSDVIAGFLLGCLEAFIIN